MKRLKFKANLAEVKSKLKKHAPELLVAATTIAGTAGWILAGIYAKKVKDLEAWLDDPDGWPSISISPKAMDDILDGATLKYRMAKTGDHSYYIQSTTADDFSDEANEKFNSKKQV